MVYPGEKVSLIKGDRSILLNGNELEKRDRLTTIIFWETECVAFSLDLSASRAQALGQAQRSQ